MYWCVSLYICVVLWAPLKNWYTAGLLVFIHIWESCQFSDSVYFADSEKIILRVVFLNQNACLS